MRATRQKPGRLQGADNLTLGLNPKQRMLPKEFDLAGYGLRGAMWFSPALHIRSASLVPTVENLCL
jgi:hypothetical protein